MTEMHTDGERAYLLNLAGVKPADVAALAPSFVIAGGPAVGDLDERAHTLVNDVLEPGQLDPVLIEVDPTDPIGSTELLVQAILAKSRGNKDTALQMVDAHVQAEFDRLKLSKLQAAAQGLTPDGKTEHNRNAWARCQKLGERMKTAVRDHHRTNGGFVTAKIRGGKA